MDNPNPSGGGGVPNAAAPTQTPSTPGGAPNGATDFIEVREDQFVKLPGQDKPVRYGDYHRNFQAEFTRKSQEAARLAAERQRFEQAVQERDRKIAAYEEHLRRQAQPSNKPQGDDITQAIRALPYLKGEDAARVVEHLSQRFEGFNNELQRRDYALGLLYKQLMNMNKQLSGLSERTVNSDFDSKIKRWVSDLGYEGPEYEDLAKEVYLAHEGDDLDQEFPNMLRERLERLERAIESRKQRRAEEARRRPFVPGQGGQGSTPKPLSIPANASAKELADAFWPGMVDGEIQT